MKNIHAFWHKFWRDKDGKVAIWQFPNVPIFSWLVLLILSDLLPKGHLQSAAGFFSSAALVVWAYLEITEGASYFRRTLGVIVMLGIILSHIL